jgi:hypothetical protein
MCWTLVWLSATDVGSEVRRVGLGPFAFLCNEFSQIAASLEAACEVKRPSHAWWVNEPGTVTNSLSRRERRGGETVMLAGIKPRPCCHTRRSERPSTV